MRYVFGDYELDTRLYKLCHEGQPCKLEPQVFNVLLYLIQHRERVVPKDELLDQLWPHQFISVVTLNHHIMAARKAIGDSGRAQRCVQTLYGRGYRFIAEVRAVEPSIEPPPRVPVLPSAPPAPSTMAAPVSLSWGGLPQPFVAREAELQHLHQCLAAALQGERQVVWITGEAGIGKTTLVDAFVTQVAPTAPMWLGRGQCLEQHGAGEPYLPLLEALGRLGRGPDGEQLVAVLRQQAPSWLVQLPALVPEEDYAAVLRRGGGATRERMLRELAEAVEALTATQPMVLVLEDLHWSDGATVDWLTYVARRREVARLLVLGTYRPTEALVHGHPVHTAAQELHRHGQGHELALGYFPEAAVAAYLAQRFGTPQPPTALVRALRQRTTGNPLFVTAVVDMLVRQGQLREGETSGADGGDLVVHMGDVPDSLRQLIEQQLADLPPEVQAVLEAASVAGKEFAVAPVAAAMVQAVEAVEDHCEALARQGQFLRTCGTDVWPDGTVAQRYGFLHDLYRETLYTRVPVGRRVRWHRQIGLRLETGYGPQARGLAAELAAHFVCGRDCWRAAQYSHYAGEQALQRSAHQEALQHLTRGLELLATLPETPARAQQELDLQLVLGSALTATKGIGAPEVEHSYARARSLCQQVGETSQIFPTLVGLGRFYLNRAELLIAHELGEQLLRLAHRTQDLALVMEAHRILGAILFWQGELASARAHLEEGITLYHPRQHGGHAFLYIRDPGIEMHSFMAWSLWYLGYPDQAVKSMQEALRLTDELTDPYSLAVALNMAAGLHQCRRESLLTQERAEAVLTLVTAHGFAQRWASSTVLLGWARAEQGCLEEGITQMRQGLAAWQATGSKVWRPTFLALLAAVWAKAAQVEEGLTALAEALAAIDNTGERFYEAELYRLKGECLLQQTTIPTSTKEAEACFQYALAVARRQQAKSWELRAATSLSHLWRQQGKRTAAYELLAPLYGWFSEGFDTVDLKEAKALLDELAG